MTARTVSTRGHLVVPLSKRFRYTFDVFRAQDGWRWRLWARNGRIVADGGEAYTRKAAAVKACERIQDYVSQSTIYADGVGLT